MDLKKQIQNIIKGEVKTDRQTLDTFSKDASVYKVSPQVVVFPKDSKDVQALVNFVAEKVSHGFNLSLTPRAAGTDMSGGDLSESIVVSFTKYFNHIRKIGKDYAVVEPGVYYRDFEKAAKKKKLLLPSYPASKDLAALGGIVANNSGGELNLLYGKTERYIQEVKMVLADGQETTFKPLTMAELEKKKHAAGLEGEIYTKMFDLIDQNYALLQSAKPKVSKNSAGYYLWNVYDKAKGNAIKLFLSFIPEAWMVLTGGIPKLVMLVEFSSDKDAEAIKLARDAQKSLQEFNLKTKLILSDSGAEKYWVIRRESFSMLRNHVQGMRTAPLIDDFVVRPEVLGEFLPKLYKILDKYNLLYTVAGHVGDCNFHIIPLMKVGDPKVAGII